MYLTYSDYLEAHPAHKVSETDFTAYEAVAESAIDAYTFSVLRKSTEALSLYSGTVKRVMGMQLEFMGSFKSLDDYCAEAGKTVQSHSINVGGTSESVTYAVSGIQRISEGGGLKISPVVVSLLAPIRATGRRL